jgi:cyclic pyranopterin phosphate synthase
VRYEVNEGRVSTWALETHLVDHCNLRCAHCCTRSPELAERFVDLGALERDLARARRVLAPSVFKLTGGEPTLHPQLVEAVQVARASGIAPVVSVTTNGLCAASLPDRFWQAIDRLTLSLYSSAPLPERTQALVRQRCAEHGVQLVVKAIDRFQVLDLDAPRPAGADDATHATFAACWLRHRCHMLHDGRFYACTRPPHLEQAGVAPGLADADGCELELRPLLAYLEREEPLESCRHCAGGGGPWEPHRQLPLARIRARTAPA